MSKKPNKKLISDSIVKQTGQRFLNAEYTSENVQFVALMDSAINLSGILGLEVGKALSSEQLANLSEDIVWMEEKIVAGEKVLVPVIPKRCNNNSQKRYRFKCKK